MAQSIQKEIRVLLVDDHALVRTGLCLLIERHPRMSVVGEAADGVNALELVASKQPNIVLLDLDLGGEISLDIVPEIIQSGPNARIILVTGVQMPAADYERAVRLGVMGLVRKEQAAEVLVQAIEKVHAGEVWLDASIVARVLAGMSNQRVVGEIPANSPAARIARLTTREREVITLVGEGLHNKQIAGRLRISEATVSHHLTSIFAKLELANRFDLVIYAYRHGLAKPPR